MVIPKIRKLPSGSYFCQLRIGGQSISITDIDPDVVYAKAAAYKAGLIKLRKAPADVTLRQACTSYIDGRRSRLSPTTIAGYELIRDKYFKGIMDKKVSTLTKQMLDRAVDEECATISRYGRPRSAKSVKNSFTFIASVLREVSPDTDTSVRLPEVKRKVPVIIPPDVLLPVIIGSNIELPCLLSAWLSLSLSEILGLTKSKSINYGQLHIVETLVLVNGKPVRKQGGKEEKRTRALAIPPYIQGLIDKVDGDIIVPLHADVIKSRFKRLLQKNGLPHMSFHKLRHLNASVMAMLGIPETDANERGGWKTDYVRKQVYSHSFTESRNNSDAKIDNFFEKIINPVTNPDGNFISKTVSNMAE